MSETGKGGTVAVVVPVGWERIERAASDIGLAYVVAGGSDEAREEAYAEIANILTRLWKEACTDTLDAVRAALAAQAPSGQTASTQAPSGRA